MLQCSQCSQLFHWDCVSCLKTKPLFGDKFYTFTCSVCNSGKEEYERDTLSWVQVIYIVLYHLIHAEPEKKYFRWRENICATINDNWDALMPGKAKTATWHNTVAGCLSTHNLLFKSGFDDTQQPGNWTLQEVIAPSLAKFKGPTKKADPSGRAPRTYNRGESKKASSRKRSHDDTVPNSEAEKEILEVLNEGGKRSNARHRVSFSDDDSEDEHRRRKARAKRSRPTLKSLDADMDLLQSFELFTKMEKERTGGGGGDKSEEVESNASAMTATDTKGNGEGDGDSFAIEDIEMSSTDEGEDEEEVKLEKQSVRPILTDDEDEEQHIAHPRTAANHYDTTSNNNNSISDEDNDDDDDGATAIHEDDPAPDDSHLSLGWTSLAGSLPKQLFDILSVPGTRLEIMKERAEWDLCSRLDACRVPLNVSARRLRRRLHMRRTKRVLGQRVFDIDAVVAKCMAGPQKPCANGREIDYKARRLLREDAASDQSDEEEGDDETLHQQKGDSASQQSKPDTTEFKAIMATPYANSFASRLLGRAVMDDSLTALQTAVSPFHGRFLRPYIWRQSIDLPSAEAIDQRRSSRASLAALSVHRCIKTRAHPLFARMHLEGVVAPERESIDYVFLQRDHLPQVNALLCRTFWPGIDMSEALTYPEFSIVALYKRTVVGCAFLTPDAYLTYIAVAAGWEGAGIATFMIHHLTQTLPTKDVTLHVSATNLAMLLYQRFGFKPERFAVNFYKSYLPKESRQCPNAFFMRLRRY
ncbi:hypothetical protein FBU59_002333 [Linderina macrospora]|uniref:Uncharacterized protein n=1 Tax=Linderina macrospora TaxID=4868 RepID=A0ACC1JBG5_9FUNG|nr:hypothetical protein FBU59_002333 [Linderina macrospora]